MATTQELLKKGDYLEVYYELGTFFEVQGKYIDAQKYMLKSMELNDNNPNLEFERNSFNGFCC